MKKILIIVPHEDDEINLAGGLIYSLKNKDNVYVTFVTNGDFIYKAKYRYMEAIKSLGILGVKKDNIIFLGYADQAYDQSNHMYNSEKDWTSKSGRYETYGALNINEWNYKKHGEHCKYNKSNVTRNIKEIILDIMPQEILCVDLDFHPDHIMTSLCFEKAMGEILNECKEYRPEVLKTFTYENSYMGKKDFFLKDNYSKFEIEKSGALKNNPYYNIRDGIKIPIKKLCYSLNLFKNPVFKAIKAHVSQILVKHATSIINKDFVYWKRETDNLLNDAIIKTTSSDSKYLHDFLLADTKNVLKGNINPILYSEKIWIPGEKDDKKIVYIDFKKAKYVDCIKIYNGRINNEFIKKILVTIDGKEQRIDLKYKFVNEIEVKKNCTTITVKVLDKICKNGFSEIEALSNSKRKVFLYDYLDNENGENKHQSKIHRNIEIIFDKLYLKILCFIMKIERKIFVR